MKRTFAVSLFVLTMSMALLAGGCKSSSSMSGASCNMKDGSCPMMDKMPTKAIAVIHPTKGNTAMGTVTFEQTNPDHVHVMADLEGLAPSQQHAFHIHEFGDCSSPDGMSAGSHYDPMGTHHHGMPSDYDPMGTHHHGMPSDDANKAHHAGDMGNVMADGAGRAHVDLIMLGINICGMNPILGRAVIIHAKPDDFGQPVGNAGGRIGCGIIGIAKTPAPAN